jgi:hypothetical protein
VAEPGAESAPTVEIQRASVDVRANVIDLRAPLTRRPDLRGLPSFPSMRVMDDEMAIAVRPFVLAFDDYSDFNGASLFGWSGSVPGGYRIARLGDNLVVEFGDYLTGQRFLSFLGEDHPDDAAAELLDDADRRGLQPELHLVPAVTAQKLDPDRWSVTEDPDAADYLFDVASLASMRGSRYRTLRHAFNSWERQWGEQAALEWMDLDDLRSRTGDILDLLEQWQRRGSGGASQSEQELRAIEHILGSSARVAPGLSGWTGTCSVGGELVAMFINEREDQHRLAGHFLKVSDHPAGNRLYSWLCVQVCRRAEAHGVRTLNMQQDLGIEGIRAAKERLRPIGRLEKFSVGRAGR